MAQGDGDGIQLGFQGESWIWEKASIIQKLFISVLCHSFPIISNLILRQFVDADISLFMKTFKLLASKLRKDI